MRDLRTLERARETCEPPELRLGRSLNATDAPPENAVYRLPGMPTRLALSPFAELPGGKARLQEPEPNVITSHLRTAKTLADDMHEDSSKPLPVATPAATLAQHSLFPQSVGEWLAIGGVLLGGLLLRIACLDAPLWIDELHTSWVVAGTLSEVAPRAAAGNQPPAFFWIVYGIIRIAGHSEFSLRLPSIIAGTLSLAACYGLVRKWTASHLAGLAAALLVATDRNMLFYATEARSYAVVQFIGLIQLGATWQFLDERQVTWRVPLHALLITTSTLLAYLHFTASLLLAIECLLVLTLLSLRKLPLKSALWFLVDIGIVMLLVLPLQESFMDVLQRKGNWQPYASENHWLANYARALRLPCYLTIPVAIAILGALRRRTFRLPQLPHGALILFLCSWTLLPLLFMALSGMTLQPVLIRRFAVISLFGPIMLCALSISTLRNSHGQRLAIILAVGVSLWQSGMVAQFHTSGKLIVDKREQWCDAIAQIRQQVRRGDVVLVHSGLIEAGEYARGTQTERAYCLLPTSGIYPLPGVHRAPLPALPSVKSLQTTVGTWTEQHARVWLLLRIGSDRASRLRDQLQDGGLRVLQHGQFGGVQTFLVTPTSISRHE